MKTLILLCVFLLGLSCSSQNKKEDSVVSTTSAKANITGKVEGTASFTPTAQGVVMKVFLSGLSPHSTHGYHIHEKGVCNKPDYKSAGDHFNPNDHSHGGPSAPIKHLGDLGNLVANKDGVAEKEVLMTDLKDVNIIKDKAIIVHEKADDLVSQPTGDSGSRIACGVIRLE